MNPQAAITVYSKPECVQCNATYRVLNQLGLDYEVVNVAEDAAALDMLKERGFHGAPVVIAGDAIWSGFRPARIKALAAQQLIVS